MPKAGWPAGKSHSAATKRKMADAARGKRHSAETKRRIALAMQKHFKERSEEASADASAA